MLLGSWVIEKFPPRVRRGFSAQAVIMLSDGGKTRVLVCSGSFVTGIGITPERFPMSCCASPALDWDGLSEQSQKGDECRLDIWSFRRRKKGTEMSSVVSYISKHSPAILTSIKYSGLTGTENWGGARHEAGDRGKCRGQRCFSMVLRKNI